MVVLLAACGYNWWQVRRLEAEVSELKTRLVVPTRPAGPGAKWPATERELRQEARDLKNALDGAWPSRSPRALRDLQAQTEQLRRQADTLWREARSVTGRHSP